MNKSIFSSFKNDTTREQGGVTMDLGDLGQIQVARAGGANVSYEKALLAASKPHRRAFQAGVIDEKVAKKIMVDVYADTIILGWSGLKDENGADFPFSKDNARKLLTDLPDLFAQIRAVAEDQTLFRQEILEQDAKN